MMFLRRMNSFLLLTAVMVWPARAEAPATSTAPAAASVDEIRQAIRNLNHPSVTRRRAAIRQLAEWGPIAFPELRRAASDRNLESALSARDLLVELESAIFLGARVHLELSRTHVDWNEPLSLTVVAANPTPGTLRVPWPVPATQPASRPAIANADQVAAMMDVADYLEVTGPDGKTIDVRVEPIERDAAVYAAVDQRARATPPSHVIGPGQRAQLTIPLFNRGWARYPLLRKGTYRIEFSYQPKWKDESWTQDGFGQVRAGPVSLTVRDAAPAGILQGEGPLELLLERAGDTVRAVLVSHWDVPLWVNLNLGGSALTHARLEWELIPLRQDDAEPVELAVDSSAPDFEPKRVSRIDAGRTLVAGSILVADIQRRLKELDAQGHTRYALQARYLQLATTGQLRDELVKLGKPQEVPVHLFSGAAVSEDVEVDSLLPR